METKTTKREHPKVSAEKQINPNPSLKAIVSLKKDVSVLVKAMAKLQGKILAIEAKVLNDKPPIKKQQSKKIKPLPDPEMLEELREHIKRKFFYPEHDKPPEK